MSRAFVKEPEGADAIEDLPDRPISPHPNLVTAQGLALIDAELARLHRQVIAPASDATKVQFGSTVTIARDGGRRQTFRIVGEDEADPARGTLSHASPLARALFGKKVGDVVQAGQSEADILEIA
jgi:transcription elongation GreA/GreB family factor